MYFIGPCTALGYTMGPAAPLSCPFSSREARAVKSLLEAAVKRVSSCDSHTLTILAWAHPHYLDLSVKAARNRRRDPDCSRSASVGGLRRCMSQVPIEVVQTVHVPVEVVVQVEKIVEVVKEIPVESLREVVKEVPIAKIVEVVKEVPVDKVREVVKEVPVEKIVEVIKEVPVEVLREVIKEVPVDRIVEVIKEVPVEKIVLVEKRIEVIVKEPVEVIKEVRVEVVKEVIKEVPVERVVERIVEVPTANSSTQRHYTVQPVRIESAPSLRATAGSSHLLPGPTEQTPMRRPSSTQPALLVNSGGSQDQGFQDVMVDSEVQDSEMHSLASRSASCSTILSSSPVGAATAVPQGPKL